MPTRIVATVDPTRSLTDGRTDHDQHIRLDADPPEGDDAAASPKEAVLVALAGCTAMDVASILRKKRQTASSYEIEVVGESGDEYPKVFTTITVEHRVAGDVEAEALRRSIELSVTRYCAVTAMLSASVSITHRYRLTTADGESVEALVAVTGPGGAEVAPKG